MSIENVRKFLEMLREYEDVQTIVGDVLENQEDEDSDAAKILAIADDQDLHFSVGEFLMETARLDETSLDYIAGGRGFLSEGIEAHPRGKDTENGRFLERLALCYRNKS